MAEHEELSTEQFLDKLRNFTGEGTLTDNLATGRMELRQQGPDGISEYFSPDIYQMTSFSADRFISQVQVWTRHHNGRLTKQILRLCSSRNTTAESAALVIVQASARCWGNEKAKGKGPGGGG